MLGRMPGSRGQLSFDLIMAVIVLLLAFQTANSMFGDISSAQEQISARLQAKSLAQTTAFRVSGFSALPAANGFSAGTALDTKPIFSPKSGELPCNIEFSPSSVKVSVNLGALVIDETFPFSGAPLFSKEMAGGFSDTINILCGETIFVSSSATGPVPPQPTECTLLNPGVSNCNEGSVCFISCDFLDTCEESSVVDFSWNYVGDCSSSTLAISMLNDDLSFSDIATGLNISSSHYSTTLGGLGLSEGSGIESGRLDKVVSIRILGE